MYVVLLSQPVSRVTDWDRGGNHYQQRVSWTILQGAYSDCCHTSLYGRPGISLCYTLFICYKVVTYSITSAGHRADPAFLAVSPQVIVINPVVGCRYFPPDPRLLSQPNRSSPWPVPNYPAWWQRHTDVSIACPRPVRNSAQQGLEPETCESQVRCPANSATAFICYPRELCQAC